MLLAGAASVEVSSPEEVSAVDVEMKDANGDADPKAAGVDQRSNAAAPAKGAPAGPAGNEAPVGNALKLENAVKKEREITVDQDLVHAFRYFDKTGQCCCGPLAAVANACGMCAGCSISVSCIVISKVLCTYATSTPNAVEEVLHATSLLHLIGFDGFLQVSARIIFGAGTGYMKIDDMRKILHNLGLRLSYRQVKELCAHVAEATAASSRSNRTDRIFYRQITDTSADDA